MKTKFQEELLENSAISLKITVPKAGVSQEYDLLVDSYRKKVAIKGFRRGKVPSEILIRKMGESLKAEATQNLIEKSLKEVFEKIEHKPLPYALPALKEGEKLELDLQKSFSFEVTYDTFPAVELGEHKGFDIEEPIVEIAGEDMERELAAIQQQNAVVVDKTEGKTKKGDTVTIDYVELGEKGDEIEGKKREGFTFEVGSGYNLYKIDDDVIDMGKDEEKVIEKSYADDHEDSELAGRTVRLKVKLTGLKEIKLPEIDDELAQDISEKYKNLEDLKTDIAERMKESSKARVRETNIRGILDKVVAGSKIPLPKSMVEQELGTRWQNFTMQFRSDEKLVEQMLAQQDKSKADLFEEWKQGTEETLRSRLVVDKLGEVENIQVSDEEVDEQIEEEAKQSERKAEEVKSEYADRNMLDYLRDRIKTNKIYDLLLENNNIGKGSKVKFLDFMQGNR